MIQEGTSWIIGPRRVLLRVGAVASSMCICVSRDPKLQACKKRAPTRKVVGLPGYRLEMLLKCLTDASFDQPVVKGHTNKKVSASTGTG